MKSYTFRATIEIDETVDANSEEEARQECLQMLDELGFSNFLIPHDLELTEVADSELFE